MSDPSIISSGISLEEYISLAKSISTAQDAIDLVQRVLNDPSVFVFGELMEIPSIVALKTDQKGSQYFALLELMAFGTFEEYLKNSAAYPPLNDIQKRKLQQLSIVSLAFSAQVIKYSDIMEKLQLSTIRELEDIVIQCIQRGLFIGRLDQSLQLFEVEMSMGRDLKPGQLNQISERLGGWTNETISLQQSLEQRLSEVTSSAVQREDQSEQIRKIVEAKTQSIVEGMTRKGSERMTGVTYDSSEYHHEERNRQRRLRDDRGQKRHGYPV